MAQPAGTMVDYDPFAELPLAQHIIRDYTARIGIVPGSSVLDIGAGTGESALEVLQHLQSDSGSTGRITLLEPEQRLLEVAQTRLPADFVECTQGFAQDIETLGFPENSFDFSIWSNGIHYVGEPGPLNRVLRAIQRCTKSKFCAWSTFMSDAYVGKTGRFAGLWVLSAYRLLGIDPKKGRTKSESLQSRGAEEYKAALLEAGFAKVETRLDTFELGPETYEAIARFDDYVDNAMPPIPNRPDLTLAIRSQALVDSVKVAYDRLGVSTLPRNWLYIEATP